MIEEHIRSVLQDKLPCLLVICNALVLIVDSARIFEQLVHLGIAILHVVIGAASVETRIEIAIGIGPSAPTKQRGLEIMCGGIAEQGGKRLLLNIDRNSDWL